MSNPAQLSITLRVSSLAAAIATINGLGEAHSIIAFNACELDDQPATAGAPTAPAVDKPQPDPKPETEVKQGKGKSKPAANAADTASAGKPDAASAQTTGSQTPSTSATQPSEATKVVPYAESDLPGRIQKIVETAKTSGDATQKTKLVALIGEYTDAAGATLKSAKGLQDKDLADFSAKLAKIEAGDGEDDIG